MRFSLYLVLTSFLFLSGCAFGPIVGGESARSVGDGGKDVIFGYGQAGYVFKFNYGLNPNWDLGMQLEALSIGVRTKYAFINNQELGWSLAGALGAGSSFGGTHYYADVIGSYLNSGWEPYLIARLVHIVTDPVKFADTNNSFLNGTTIPSTEYNYGQVMLGLKYWFTKNWNFNAEVGSLSYLSVGTLKGNAFVTGTFGYRF